MKFIKSFLWNEEVKYCVADRTAQLNRWMGTLMSKFHLYPSEAQELICDFLTLADDDPAEPQGKTILSMFVFMRIFQFNSNMWFAGYGESMFLH